MSVYEVANRFIEIYNNKREKLSNRKLQKLVYLAYGFYLVFENKKLFDEKFEAWPHGPVCKKLYDEIKENNNVYNVKNVLDVSNKSTENAEIINQTVSYIEQHFGILNADKLEKITMRPYSAWDKIINNKVEDILELDDKEIRIEILNIIYILNQ